MANDLATRLSALLTEKGWWRPRMAVKGHLHVGNTTKLYKGTIAVREGRPCVLTRRWLTRGNSAAVFFAEPPVPLLRDPATAGVLHGLACSELGPVELRRWDKRWFGCVNSAAHALGSTPGDALARLLLEAT